LARETAFRGVVEFLDRLGVYDVLLPFLLVFTIVFAILEKTRVLGTDKVGDEHWSKKNLNAMVAFVVAFLVIASTSLVRVINEFLANIVLLIILVIAFLMLVGIFMGTGESTLEKYPGWMSFFMVILFIGIVLILLEALDWLREIIYFFQRSIDTEWIATLVLLIIVLAVMLYVTRDSRDTHMNHKENKK
jgi:hypothetical protein